MAQRLKTVLEGVALSCIPLTLCVGCMSLYCHSRGPEDEGLPSYIYPGTEAIMRYHLPKGLIDLPFSFCVDTIALPFDLYAVSIGGRPRYDCQIVAPPLSTNTGGRFSVTNIPEQLRF